VTEFLVSSASFLWGITTGSDGNLWFTEQIGSTVSKIGRITTAGVVTGEFPISGGSQPGGITAGPDGNLWFTEADPTYGNKIGRITPSGVVTEFSAGITAGSWPETIATGLDGNLWFTEYGASYGNKIGRITPSGVVTEFPVTAGSQPTDITAGPDGNIWFTETNVTYGNKIGHVSQITYVRLMNGTHLINTYSLLQDAIDGANIDGEIIQAMKKNFPEVLTYSGSASIVLKGGYDSGFTNNPDSTTVTGSLTISTGTVTVENVILE
jgi:hypothetical protein